MRLARVVAVHPGRRTVDVVYTGTGQRVAELQVMGDAGMTAGTWRVPDVPKPASEETADAPGPGQNLLAVVDTVEGRPVVMGFLAPLGNELGQEEQNRTIERHVSGAYTTIAPDGSIELFHPAGAYLRIGTGEHQDLAGVTAGGKFSVPSGAVPAQVTVATAGFTLTIEPNGATTLTTGGELHVSYARALLSGDVAITGNLTATGEITAKAGSGGFVTLSGHRGHVNGGPPPTPGT